MEEGKDGLVPITLAAVEGGGQTFRIAVAQLHDGKQTLLHRISIDSSHEDPARTLFECCTFLKGNMPSGGYHALGVATFGPVGVNPSLATYGCLLSSSPKRVWRNVDILTPLVEACQGSERTLAVKVETDVNAPAWAEYEYINQQEEGDNISSLAYVTVGTGVGVGLVVNHLPVHGRMHPEGGHVPVQPLAGDVFPGYSWGLTHCPFYGKHTVEGIASSVALTERLQQSVSPRHAAQEIMRNVLEELPDDHDIWNHAANALANLCVTLILTTSVERIVMGGGILQRNGLLGKVRKQTFKLMNGYVELPEDMSELIQSSTWGDQAGIVGAVMLARKAHEEQQQKEKSNATTTTYANSTRSTYPYLGGVLTGALVMAGVMMLIGKRNGSTK